MLRRMVLVVFLAAMAGCTQSPASLGLTGGTAPPPPARPNDAVIGVPGLTHGSGTFSPSLAPGTGGGQFYGYN